MGPEYTTALVRALISGIAVAGASFFATWAASDDSLVGAVAAGAAFFGIFVARFGAEGTADANKAGGS